MFTRLVVGLDGSPWADVALEQAVVLGRRFRSTIVVAGADRDTLERARARIEAAGLAAQLAAGAADPEVVLAELSRDADAVLVGRRGVTAADDPLSTTVAALVRTAPGCVVVCGAAPSPMRVVALAFDGRETSRRALELAAQFASVVGSIVHVVHANDDRAAGLRVVGEAEATLSLREADFAIHVEPGTPGAAVARIVKEARCDALFVGAHVARTSARRPSPVVVSHAEQILRHTDVPVVIQP